MIRYDDWMNRVEPYMNDEEQLDEGDRTEASSERRDLERYMLETAPGNVMAAGCWLLLIVAAYGLAWQLPGEFGLVLFFIVSIPATLLALVFLAKSCMAAWKHAAFTGLAIYLGIGLMVYWLGIPPDLGPRTNGWTIVVWPAIAFIHLVVFNLPGLGPE